MAYPSIKFFRRTPTTEDAAGREVLDFLIEVALLVETIRGKGLFGALEEEKSQEALRALQNGLKKAQRTCSEALSKQTHPA